MPTFKLVQLTYSNGEQSKTCVNRNSTNEELTKYFLHQWFDRGVFEEENMQRCVKVEFLGEVTYES